VGCEKKFTIMHHIVLWKPVPHIFHRIRLLENKQNLLLINLADTFQFLETKQIYAYFLKTRFVFTPKFMGRLGALKLNSYRRTID